MQNVNTATKKLEQLTHLANRYDLAALPIKLKKLIGQLANSETLYFKMLRNIICLSLSCKTFKKAKHYKGGQIIDVN